MRIYWSIVLSLSACVGTEELTEEEQEHYAETYQDEELMRLFPDGATCGEAVCKAGEYCCDSSCGLCLPFASACAVEVGTCENAPW